jgi:hypothetical protein
MNPRNHPAPDLQLSSKDIGSQGDAASVVHEVRRLQLDIANILTELGDHTRAWEGLAL